MAPKTLIFPVFVQVRTFNRSNVQNLSQNLIAQARDQEEDLMVELFIQIKCSTKCFTQGSHPDGSNERKHKKDIKLEILKNAKMQTREKVISSLITEQKCQMMKEVNVLNS